MKRIAILLLVLFANSVVAQDNHFSQWSNAPLTINPAMSGLFSGKLRFSNAYRSQWSGITKAYSTIHASLDAPVLRSLMKGGQSFGVGFLVMQDRAGSDAFRATTIQGSLSYTTPIDAGDNFFSVGFHGGLNQFAIDLENSTWISQWNGDQYDAAAGMGEAVQLTQFTHVDLGAGIFWHYVPDQHNFLYSGFSVAHVGAQNVSYFKEGKNPMHRRYAFNIGSEISLNEFNQSWFAPKALVMMQGSQKMIQAGGTLKNKVQFKSHYTNYTKEVMYSLGMFYRFQDAIIVALRFEYNNLSIGLSYDYTVSSLQRNAGAGSAYEVTIAILNPLKRGELRNNYNKMPKFF